MGDQRASSDCPLKIVPKSWAYMINYRLFACLLDCRLPFTRARHGGRIPPRRRGAEPQIPQEKQRGLSGCAPAIRPWQAADTVTSRSPLL